MIKSVYGESAMILSRVFSWVPTFKAAREYVEDNKRSYSIRHAEMFAPMYAVINSDHYIRIKTKLTSLNMSVGSVFTIIKDGLMKWLLSNFLICHVRLELKYFAKHSHGRRVLSQEVKIRRKTSEMLSG